MDLKAAIEIVNANEWQGDFRINFMTMRRAARFLADELERVQGKIEEYEADSWVIEDSTKTKFLKGCE
tara:strand:- start:139 stop:342 length:204 start_codon:yes stop_codon:yes gene_type:complete